MLKRSHGCLSREEGAELFYGPQKNEAGNQKGDTCHSLLTDLQISSYLSPNLISHEHASGVRAA